MKIPLSAAIHATIGAAVVSAVVFASSQPANDKPAMPNTPTPPAMPAMPSMPAMPGAPGAGAGAGAGAHGEPGAHGAVGANPGANPKPDMGVAGQVNPALNEVDPAKAMQEWMAMSSPGVAHEKLKAMEGSYKTTTRVWQAPGAQPLESQGKASFKMILGGRFLQQDFEGQMMGMPQLGLGLLGYDNHRKQFMGVWCDTFSTTMYTMAGGLSKDGKTITMFGEMDEPSTKEIGKIIKWVTRQQDKDTFFFEAWEVQYGEPFLVMQVQYERTK